MKPPVETASRGRPQRVDDARALVRLITPGERIYLPGAAAEVPSLVDALCENGAPPVTITATFVPGINRAPLDRLPQGTTYESLFAQPGPPGAQLAGRFRQLPVSYGAYAALLARSSFDICVVHVTPPDANGLCSLGAAVEFTPIVIERAKRIFAVVNPRMPRLAGAETFSFARAEAYVEIDAPLRTYDVGAPSDEAQIIGERIANFVDDGAALQIGLGKVPDVLMRLLTDRRRLRLHSGMLSDGARLLVESGSLDPAFPHASCVHVGTADYYDWLADNKVFAVRSCTYTHGAATLAGIDSLVAVNSALSVDLFGQANLEMLDGRSISGAGGAPDFARATAMSPTGISIVALPSTAGRSQATRILPQIDGMTSLPRHDIDVIITEQGVADLRGCTVMERAERILAVAAPQHRTALADAWQEIAKRL